VRPGQQTDPQVGQSVSRTYTRLLARPLVPTVMRPKTTRRTPITSRTSPTLWTLNPLLCTVVANLRMAPMTTTTIPTTAAPIPELLLMGPECRANPGKMP
jgi:hypothetical protein